MARPLKQGLDYFSLDVDIDQDDKIQLVEALHGIKGFGMLIKLFMRIYREGYYYKWTDTEQILFTKRVNDDINVVNEVVNDCIKYGVFDKNLFEQYEILTSHGIQKRYFEASTRRKHIDIVEEYLLVNVKNEVNVNKKEVNVSKNPTSNVVNDLISTERKGKERERKGKYGDFVTLLKSEYEKLVAEHGELGTLEIIKILDNYKGASGKKYKSDYRAILTWVVKRFKEEQSKHTTAAKPTSLYKPFVFDPSRGEE